MGSSITFLKHIPPELLMEYIIPCLQLVEVKEFMQTSLLYYKIGKSQMYKQFIYRLNRRLYELHPALLLQQFDSFNADYYPQIHNRVVYGDLLHEVYTGVKPNPTTQSYKYTLGFFIHHGESRTPQVPNSVMFVQEHLPELQGSIRFQLTSIHIGRRYEANQPFVCKRRTWDATITHQERDQSMLVHRYIKFIVESVIASETTEVGPGLTHTTPYLSGSTLVVPPGGVR